jgi:hypothetical protein
MATLNKAAFETTYADAAGTFQDNTTRQITESDLRQFSDDIADSLIFTSGGSPALTVSTSIPTATMVNANSIPVEVIPAQGAGIIIVPIMFLVQIQYGSAPFAVNTTFRFEIDGEPVSDTNTTILPSVADRTVNVFILALDTATDLTNKPCVLEVQTGDPIGGTGSIVFVSAVFSTLNVS